MITRLGIKAKFAGDGVCLSKDYRVIYFIWTLSVYKT